ncbi:MAG TPA: hypothetical protein VGZ47_06215, partial [Gemmataceae bacterium]|nr:hypothetical protein [Gemmataceae bacterium]
MMSHPFVRLHFVLGGLLAVSGFLVAQQPPAKPDSAPPKADAAKPADAKEDPFEKRVTVTFDNKPW